MQQTQMKDINQLKEYSNELKLFLTTRRISFFQLGYNHKEACRLQSRKCYLVSKLRKNGLKLKEFYGIYQRLFIYENDNGINEIGYIGGQSYPDEILTLLECVTDSLRE